MQFLHQPMKVLAVSLSVCFFFLKVFHGTPEKHVTSALPLMLSIQKRQIPFDDKKLAYVANGQENDCIFNFEDEDESPVIARKYVMMAKYTTTCSCFLLLSNVYKLPVDHPRSSTYNLAALTDRYLMQGVLRI